MSKSPFLARARASWGDALPDWIEALSRECDAASQASVARRVGYSAATLSYVMKGMYNGDLTAVEKAVRGALMALTVDCPVLGEMAADTCLVNQRATYSPHNAGRILLASACPDCAHNRTAERRG